MYSLSAAVYYTQKALLFYASILTRLTTPFNKLPGQVGFMPRGEFIHGGGGGGGGGGGVMMQPYWTQ